MMDLIRDHVCSLCGRHQELLVEEEAYYDAGRKKKVLFLCTESSYRESTERNSTARALAAARPPSRCYFDFTREESLLLTVAGYQEITYDAILSVFTSCPLLFLSNNGKDIALSSSSSSSISNSGAAECIVVENESEKRKGKEVYYYPQPITFETAVRVAYYLNPIARSHLNAVDKSKFKNKSDVLNPECNPRIWPLRFRIMYEEARVKVVQKEPLTLQWNSGQTRLD